MRVKGFSPVHPNEKKVNKFPSFSKSFYKGMRVKGFSPVHPKRKKVNKLPSFLKSFYGFAKK
jgi:hypothetical protein